MVLHQSPTDVVPPAPAPSPALVTWFCIDATTGFKNMTVGAILGPVKPGATLGLVWRSRPSVQGAVVISVCLDLLSMKDSLKSEACRFPRLFRSPVEVATLPQEEPGFLDSWPSDGR